VKVGAIDCANSNNTRSCTAAQIKGYPTVKVVGFSFWLHVTVLQFYPAHSPNSTGVSFERMPAHVILCVSGMQIGPTCLSCAPRQLSAPSMSVLATSNHQYT
jgi:hypothetical protein